MIDNIKEQNIKFYDTEAKSYDQIRYGTQKGKRVDEFQKRILDSYLERVNLEDSSVLEVGCGTGRFLPFMAEKGCNITGIDISEEMLKVARRRVDQSEHKKITLLQNDADEIPFRDNSFDIIYSILVINLIPDFKTAFREINRVIKPGGLFIFSVPFLDSIYFPAGIYVNSRGKTVGANESGYRYSHWFTSGEIEEAMETTGFLIEKIKGQPPYVQMTDNVEPLTTSLGMLFAKSVYVLARAK